MNGAVEATNKNIKKIIHEMIVSYKDWHGRLYQKRVKNAFDKKVRSRRFSEGDLVLKKVSQALKDNRGKWAPNYEGPFVVKRAFSGGTLVLANMDDEELPSPVNSDVVKRYYA